MKKTQMALVALVAFAFTAAAQVTNNFPALTNSSGVVITNAQGVWRSPRAERVALAQAVAATNPTNAAFLALEIRCMCSMGMTNEAAAVKANLSSNDLATVDATLASDAGNPWREMALLRQQWLGTTLN